MKKIALCASAMLLGSLALENINVEGLKPADHSKRIDQHSMMVISKYFNTVNDYINIEKCCKEYKGIMGQYHFNPIPFKEEKQRKLFKNIETYHLYGENDKKDWLENDTKIKEIIHWNKVSYSDWKENKDEKNVYKNVEFGENDMKKYLLAEENLIHKILKTENVELEEAITSLGDHCFTKCSNLSQITIPTSVSRVRSYCFASCSNLRAITLPNSVFLLPNSCFRECSNLSQITIPSSITFISNCCFYRCSNLSTITIPTSVSLIGFECFLGCSNLSTINIPSSVSSIGYSCFYSCRNLEGIIIPSSVISIGRSCFEDCDKLTEIKVVIGESGENTKVYSKLKAECKNKVRLVDKEGEVIVDTDDDLDDL